MMQTKPNVNNHHFFNFFLLHHRFKMWTADVYYSWYHVYFHVPLDERLEGLGQPHGRRIMKRFFNNGGWYEMQYTKYCPLHTPLTGEGTR